MDETFIVPFEMYSDECVLWIENFKNSFAKTNLKLSNGTFGVMGGIGVIFIVLAIIYKAQNIFLNIAAFFGACTLVTCAILIVAAQIQNNIKPKITYYITNFRLIEAIKGKELLYKEGYIKNLVNVYLDNESQVPTYVEFEWDNKADKDFAPSGFFDVSNCREIYDIIKKQQQKLKNIEYNYDFNVQ